MSSDGLIKAGLVERVCSNLIIGREKIEPVYNTFYNDLAAFNDSTDLVGPAGVEPATRRL